MYREDTTIQPLRLRQILRKVFLEDWALKLLALAISLGLWVAVTGWSAPITRRLTIPLDLSVAGNAQVVSATQQVDIEISGDKGSVEQIRSGDLTASIDLSATGPGGWAVTLSPDNVFVPLPRGVKLLDVAPGRIAVTIETVEERELDVRPLTAGSPTAGYEVYSLAALPQRIGVRGPASIISSLDAVETERIDITGRKEGFLARQTAVMSPDARVALLNTVVDVVVRIGERRIERQFTVPIDDGADSSASFSLFCPRTRLMRLSADDLAVTKTLDLNGEVLTQVVLPPDLTEVCEVRRLVIR